MTATISETAVRVTVAVPTYRRPDRLRALLPLLIEQAREVTASCDGRYATGVLVIDNDPAGTAAEVMAEVVDPVLRWVQETTPGIAAVRNRALEESTGADLLAFIDDDERPAPGWLAALLDAWTATGAAAVAGPVHPDFAAELDPWIRAGGFFDPRRLPTGTDIEVAATGNLLLDLRQVRRLGVRFETTLGLAGGEDNLFSRSLARAGGRLIWCDESTAIEHVPTDRMTRRWVLARSWSHGNAAVLTDLRLARSSLSRSALRGRGAARGLLRVAGGAATWCWGGLRASERHRAQGLRILSRGAGMVGGACGIVYQEYARNGRRWRRTRLSAR